LLGNQMGLRKGELLFNETFAEFSPQISLFFNLYAYDRQGRNVQVNMDYQGDLSDLADQSWSPKLYSQPPLPEQQLRYLVAAQISGIDSSLDQGQLFSGLLSQLGSSVVLTPLEESIRKGFKLDEVSLKTDLLGNLLNDHLGINYRLSGAINSSGSSPGKQLDHSADSASANWVKYLDNTHISFGTYLDRDNTILLSLNIDLLYRPQDTRPVVLSRDGLQIVPGFGLKFNTPLIDITWDIGIAHYNDYFITDSSLLLEWSLGEFLNRRRLAALERDEERFSNEIVPYEEE
ncbi:MAG: translocation/assembly module TamB domain-containing protein, partial [Spirochaetota bacterium]